MRRFVGLIMRAESFDVMAGLRLIGLAHRRPMSRHDVSDGDREQFPIACAHQEGVRPFIEAGDRAGHARA
jgi:hypothetical protein